jgi:hypothetical protein
MIFMKLSFTSFCIIQFITLFSVSSAFTQSGTPADTVKPLKAQVNAGFDVIIKKNGVILYGIVKEVGQQLIRYQRTDIPDGPIYTVPREEIFAISYRNQVKDILNPLKDTSVTVPQTIIHDRTPAVHDTVFVHDTTAATTKQFHKPDSLSKSNHFRQGDLRIGIGFLRSYTRVNQASQYASTFNFPIISIAYDVSFREHVRLGIQASFGPHKFTGQSYSSYDSLQTNTVMKEYIFMLDGYGIYYFPYRTERIKPYVLGGLGIHSSHVNTEYDLDFVNEANHTLAVMSGNNAISIGILARIGAEYNLNNNLSAFGDVGIGASILSFGIRAHLN